MYDIDFQLRIVNWLWNVQSLYKIWNDSLYKVQIAHENWEDELKIHEESAHISA